MTRQIRTLALGIALAATLLIAAPVGAESEWCDDGSPPPNDFGVQQTGDASVTSSYNWLYSADGGAWIYQQWSQWSPDLSLLQQLIGGIVQGMLNALTGRSGTPTYVSR